MRTPPIVTPAGCEAAWQRLLAKEIERVNNRGDEVLGNTWSYLDMTALGRQEQWEDSPEGYPQTRPYDWWHWHDEYGDGHGG